MYSTLILLVCFYPDIPKAAEVDENEIAMAEDYAKMSSETQFYAQLPVVTAPSRVAQPINETPTAITVIDRQFIEASGAREISELLRFAPGMVVGYADNARHSVSYHGMSNQYARNMQVLVDGRSVYEPSFGGLNWLSLALSVDDIEQIEVVRGPSASTHGANSLLGVISIKTRDVVTEKGLSANIGFDNHDFRRQRMRYAYVGERTNIRITAEHPENLGFDDTHDSQYTNQTVIAGDTRLSLNDVIKYEIGYSDREAQQGGAFVPSNILQATAAYQSVSLTHVTDRKNELRLQVYNNYYNDIENYDAGFFVMDRDSTKQRLDADLQYTYSNQSWLTLAVGAGLRRDSMTDFVVLNTDATENVYQARVFANGIAYLTKQAVLNIGTMVEEHEYIGRTYAPRTSLIYHTKLGTFRTSYSRAYRNPTIMEEKSDYNFRDAEGLVVYQLFDAEGGLKPAQIDSIELSYMFNKPDRYYTADVKLYHDRLKNLIRNYFTETGSMSFKNFDSAKISGAELQFDYRPKARTRLFGSYSYEVIESDNIAGLYTRSAPRHNFSLLGAYRFAQKNEVSLTYLWRSKMQWLGEDDGIGKYDRIDLRLARFFRFKKMDGRFELIGYGINGVDPDYYPFDKYKPSVIASINLHYL